MYVVISGVKLTMREPGGMKSRPAHLVTTGHVLIGGTMSLQEVCPCGRGIFLMEEAVHDSRSVLVGMGASLWEGDVLL